MRCSPSHLIDFVAMFHGIKTVALAHTEKNAGKYLWRAVAFSANIQKMTFHGL